MHEVLGAWDLSEAEIGEPGNSVCQHLMHLRNHGEH